MVSRLLCLYFWLYLLEDFPVSLLVKIWGFFSPIVLLPDHNPNRWVEHQGLATDTWLADTTASSVFAVYRHPFIWLIVFHSGLNIEMNPWYGTSRTAWFMGLLGLGDCGKCCHRKRRTTPQPWHLGFFSVWPLCQFFILGMPPCFPTGKETIQTITESLPLLAGCLEGLFNAILSPCSRNCELTCEIRSWFLAKSVTSVRVLPWHQCRGNGKLQVVSMFWEHWYLPH